MTDYGHDLWFGSFVTPIAHPPEAPIELAVASERAGVDLVSFQDHPYQPAFQDTWTLMSYAAARTERIRLSGGIRYAAWCSAESSSEPWDSSGSPDRPHAPRGRDSFGCNGRTGR